MKALDKKLNEFFGGKVVRKDLTKKCDCTHLRVGIPSGAVLCYG